MLHHVYTWNRILLESSYVLTRQESCRGMLTSCWCDACEKEHSHDMVCNLPPNPDMKLDEFLCLDEAPHDNSECRGGISNDTYLEDSKGDSKAMYRHLYGISEKWLSLVSQTTRLANLMDRMRNTKIPQDNEMLDSIEKRKSRIEDMIWELVSRDAPEASSLPHSVNTNNNAEPDHVENAVEPRAYMVRALNLGLLIFFYRRITGLNAQLLQPYVSGIVQALKGFAAACEARRMDGPGSPWPVFMAGCEALSGPDREYLSSWIDNAFSVTGFQRFDTMKLCMKEVWRKQNASNRSSGASWVDVCREKKMYVMLS